MPMNSAASCQISYQFDRNDLVLDSLMRDSYDNAFEWGCASGTLTPDLAGRCGTVLGTDIGPTAVRVARRRCKDLKNVNILNTDARGPLPNDAFDLVIIEEVGHHVDCATLRQVAARLSDHLTVQGEFVAIHRVGSNIEGRNQGDQVHAVLLDELDLHWVKGIRRDGFRLDTWIK